VAITTGHFRFGPDNGRVLLHTGRVGIGSRMGHDLTIEVTDWTAEVDVPESGSAEATVRAHLELGSLTLREGVGGAGPLTDEVRREIEENTRRTLGVDEYPTATFESSRVVGDHDRGTISGRLTLHGTTTTTVEVRAQALAPGHYRGVAVVTQSAHGIKPFSAFLGALKVRDDVEVEIDVDLAHAR
jgi:polyisoprenoid-binding protein YceI